MNKKIKKVELVLRKINYLFDSIDANPLKSSNLEMALLKRYAINLYDTILEFEEADSWEVKNTHKLLEDINSPAELDAVISKEIASIPVDEMPKEHTPEVEEEVTEDLTSILEKVKKTEKAVRTEESASIEFKEEVPDKLIEERHIILPNPEPIIEKVGFTESVPEPISEKIIVPEPEPEIIEEKIVVPEPETIVEKVVIPEPDFDPFSMPGVKKPATAKDTAEIVSKFSSPEEKVKSTISLSELTGEVEPIKVDPILPEPEPLREGRIISRTERIITPNDEILTEKITKPETIIEKVIIPKPEPETIVEKVIEPEPSIEVPEPEPEKRSIFQKILDPEPTSNNFSDPDVTEVIARPVFEPEPVEEKIIEPEPEPMQSYITPEPEPILPKTSQEDKMEVIDRLRHNSMGRSFIIDHNQRYGFVKELFAGNEQTYNKTLEDLGQCGNVIEAFTYLNLNVKLKYNWKDDNQYAQEFQRIVKDTFLKD